MRLLRPSLGRRCAACIPADGGAAIDHTSTNGQMQVIASWPQLTIGMNIIHPALCNVDQHFRDQLYLKTYRKLCHFYTTQQYLT